MLPSAAAASAASAVAYGSARLVHCCVLMVRVTTGPVPSLTYYEACKCVEGQLYFD